MANKLSEALLVSTSWNTASDVLTSQPTKTLVKDFCANTLKSDEVSKLYCTVLDVEVSEDQKKDAESVGVTLIPATRNKWADPDEDPPGVNWLFNHNIYYQQLKDLQNVKHVVSISPKTKNPAVAIQESLFPQAQLHHLSVPTAPGVVFAFDAWSRDACGLTGYHRAIIQDFIVRKAESGEYLEAYSTVVDIELKADQIEDAEKCGVTLIKAQIKKGVDKTPKLEWLVNHTSHFPELGKLQNIKYVVGYAPKTGWAAIDIHKKLFPGAKLVLINHACQEQNCLLVKDEFSELKDEMLQMASEADILFSIGPHIYDHFKRAYRAVIGGKKLSDIPHKEILPKPGQEYFNNERPADTEIEIDGPNILTYGQLNTEEALKRCDSIAACIGSAANKYKTFGKKQTEWQVHGVCKRAYKETKNFLVEKLQSTHALLKPYKQYSIEKLLQSLQQSDLCLPPSCYTDYSFEGVEAMAAGLPTTVQDDSHIAAMIERHFENHKDYCVVRNETEELTSKIIEKLTKNNVAAQKAKLLREDLAKSEAVTESLARFASSLTDKDTKTKNSDKKGKPETKEKKHEKEKETALVTEPAMAITEGSSTAETDALMSSRPSINNSEETIKTKEVKPEITLTEHMETTGSLAMRSGSSVTEETHKAETRAVIPEILVTENKESTQATAVQPGISLAEVIENAETMVQTGFPVTEGPETTTNTTVQHGMSTKEDKETADTTEVHPGMSNTKNIIDSTASTGTAVQSGMPVTEDVDTTKLTTLQYEEMEIEEESNNSDTITRGVITGDENNDRKSKKLAILGHKDRTKTKDKNNDFKHAQLEMSKKEVGVSRKRKSSGFEKSGQKESEALKPKMQRTGRVNKNPWTPPPPSPWSIVTGIDNDSTDFMVHIGLNEESYEQQLRDLDKQEPTSSVREETEKLNATWKECNGEFETNANEVTINEESQQIVSKNCKEHFGNVKVKDAQNGSLAIHLGLPTVYNLYRLEHTCLSGSFPDSFEPLLITDNMREEADKVGLQLQLKATYDQARFDELELFFINRDGGGLKPVKVYHNVIEGKKAEEIHIDGEDTNPKSASMVTGRIDSSFQTEQGQYNQSKFKMEKATLESQLEEAKGEKATLEERCKELTQKLASTEESLVSQRIGNSIRREKLQSELEQNQKLIKELENTVAKLKHNLKQVEKDRKRSVGWKVDTFGNGEDPLTLKYPCGVTIFDNNHLAVCDRDNRRVVLVNIVKKHASYFCFKDQFKKRFKPQDVAMLFPDGLLFITDRGNGQIVVTDEKSDIIRTFGNEQKPLIPFGIAVISSFVVVSDTAEHRIIKYTTDGNYIAEVGGNGKEYGQFDDPYSVAVNSIKQVLASDFNNHRIQVFNEDLKFLYAVDSGQSSLGQLRNPYGIDVDSDDNIYVCDFDNHRIVKFTSEGKLVCTLFESQIKYPMYIAVTKAKREQYSIVISQWQEDYLFVQHSQQIIEL